MLAMTTGLFRPFLAALTILAGMAWSAPAAAQFVPAPNVPAPGTGVPNSIHERLYPGIATGGMLTEQTGQQGRSPVGLGSSANGLASPPPGAFVQPIPRPSPGMTVVPRSGGDGSAGDVQGLYTAPFEQGPLEQRITP
jgi:hypothetical protein